MTQRSTLATLVGGLFFFSGFAALVYQVVWMRHLSLLFGSDVYATAITLSVFMAGLSLGSWLAGTFADRLARPLLAYGLLEIGIGLYALSFGFFLQAFTPVLRDLYRSSFETAPLLYQGVRIAVAAAVLLVPTTLMGVTLPLIITGFVRRKSELGRLGGLFYAINTLGALAGTLVAAFALMPWLGITVSTRVAVVINVVIGTVVAVIGLRVPPHLAAAPEVEELSPAGWRYQTTTTRVALFAIGLSGLAALALEVIWTRILTLSFSGTVYSFAIMLASFLFGIVYGSHRASLMIDSHANPVRFFGLLEIGLGFFIALLGILSYVAPGMFSVLVWGLTRLAGNNFAVGSVAAEFIVAGLLIVLPTILLGATFPAAVRICTPDATKAGSGVAHVYAANTAGAIIGSLLAGFVLIPAFGSRNSLVVLAAVFTANGLLLLRFAKSPPLRTDPFALIPIGATVVAAIGVLLLPQQTIVNYGLQRSARPELIYHGEGVSHSVDIVRSANRDIVMMVDGNVEADNSFVQRRHFILKGHLPLLLHAAPRDVAVVGLGLGITLAATARNPEVERIQVIELTPEMVQAHEHLDEVSGGILRHSRVDLRIDDGRNFLVMTDRRFDMITADPIHPRISGVGYLYTEEYYRAIRERLKPGGVVCQWMPMYNVSRESFDVALRTFARVFPHATFWYVRGHGLLVATADSTGIDYRRFSQSAIAPVVAQDLASIEINGPEQLLAHLMMGPSQIRAYLASSGKSTVNLDDNAYLEYHTPFEFLETTKQIVAALEPYAGFDPALLTSVTDAQRAQVRTAWESRRKLLISELDTPLR